MSSYMDYVERNRPAMKAFKKYERARGSWKTLPKGTPEQVDNIVYRNMNQRMDRFMTAPCTLEWVIFEKYQIFEAEVLHPDHFNGPAEARMWLASLKSDAVRLAAMCDQFERDRDPAFT